MRRDGPLPCAHELIEHGARPPAELPDQSDRKCRNPTDEVAEIGGGEQPQDHGGLCDDRHRLERAVERLCPTNHGPGSEDHRGLPVHLGTAIPVEHDKDFVRNRSAAHHQIAHRHPMFGAPSGDPVQVGRGKGREQWDRTKLTLGQLVGELTHRSCATDGCHENIRHHAN